MVAQGVEDEFELPAGGRDHPDVAAPTVPDPVPDPAHHAGLGQDLHGLDRGPADQPGTLLGDPPAVHVLVGLVVLGRQPGPAGQLLGPREPVHVTDLGHEHRPQDRADTGDGLHRDEPGIAGQPGPDLPGERVDLEIQGGDDPS